MTQEIMDLELQLRQAKKKEAERLIAESVNIFNNYDDSADFWDRQEALEHIADELLELEAEDELEILVENTGCGFEQLEQLRGENNE